MKKGLFLYQRIPLSLTFQMITQSLLRKMRLTVKLQMTYAEEDATYQAVKIGLSDSGDKDLSKYEGTYYSKEMDLSFKLKIKDGKLQVLLKNDWNREWWSVEYAGEEIFLNSPYFDVKIQRSEDCG